MRLVPDFLKLFDLLNDWNPLFFRFENEGSFGKHFRNDLVDEYLNVQVCLVLAYVCVNVSVHIEVATVNIGCLVIASRLDELIDHRSSLLEDLGYLSILGLLPLRGCLCLLLHHDFEPIHVVSFISFHSTFLLGLLLVLLLLLDRLFFLRLHLNQLDLFLL